MSLFVDQLLLRLSDPAQLTQLLAPVGDTSHVRLRTLLSAVYELPFATIHDVRDVQIRRTVFQQPLFPPQYERGTWTQTTPDYTRTDVVHEVIDWQKPVWLDIFADVGLTLVVEVDSGAVESILTREVTGFNTLDEFRSRFRFIDLDAFMARHGLSTVEELREAFHYLITEVRLRALTPFDPTDPSTQHRYGLNVAILIRETVDVTAALRDAKLARTAVEHSLTYRREVDVAEVRTPYAPMVIFPEDALDGPLFTAEALQTFFAAEGILVVFVATA